MGLALIPAIHLNLLSNGHTSGSVTAKNIAAIPNITLRLRLETLNASTGPTSLQPLPNNTINDRSRSLHNVITANASFAILLLANDRFLSILGSARGT